ncbi:MAG: alpha glucosidase [Magnetospirillum sp.]|nr:alpha glucosidase [Magnetospirillum sp.]
MADAWWRGAVIYQIYPRSFRDANGDGIGDLGGIAEALPYVASLGVDAVWLSPFYRSPMMDFGYDVADHRDVDPLFGTLADAKRVIGRAHDLGMKVLLDMVWGHTSDRHPWFAESRASRANAKSDWYVWADPKPDGTPPNNWLSVFGGPAWTWEPRRRQYRLHHFLPSQPALNWRNPAVVEALAAVGEHWLSLGADGLRLDAVDFLIHDLRLRDNPPQRLAEIPPRPFGMQDHRRDMMQPETADALARIRALTDRFPGTVTMAELSSAGDPLARVAEYCAPGGLHLAYSLGLMRRPASAAALKATIAEIEAKAPGGAFAWALSNHDVERAASRWGDGSPASAKMLLALLLCLRGTVCLYQGDELGLPEAEVPFDRRRDPFGLAFWPEFKGRDGCRTPMPWRGDGPAAGFSAAEPWLPVPESHRRLAVAVQEADGESVLNTLRRLIRWRRRHPALTEGGLTLVEMSPDIVAFERTGGGQDILCLFNPSAAHHRLTPPPGRKPAEGVGYRIVGGELMLEPWGAVFLVP